MMFFDGEEVEFEENFSRPSVQGHGDDSGSVSQNIAGNAGDVSTLNKGQSATASQLCIFDVSVKLKSYGEYDIGGTYTGNEPDMWFHFSTSFCPGGKCLLNLFVCFRKVGNSNIAVSKSSEITQESSTNHDQRSFFSRELKWQSFKTTQPDERFLVKTYSLPASGKNLDSRTLCIPVAIKTNPACQFNMDLVKQVKLNHGFGDLLSKHEKTNFTLQSASGQQYQVHKIIVAAHSPVLRNMVKGDDVSSIFLDINDKDMELLLQFLYTGTIKNILKQDCHNLLDIAGKFELNNLFALVQYAITLQIDVDNCMDIAMISEKYRLEKLQHTVFKFVKNHPKVFETEGWKKVDNAHLIKKMFQYLHQ